MKLKSFLTSSPKSRQLEQPKRSRTERADSHPATASTSGGAQTSRPSLKRVDSLPAQLPSNPLQRTEVKPDRKPITRPRPDAEPPVDFADPPKPRKLFGVTLPFQKQLEKRAEVRRIKDGAEKKFASLGHNTENYNEFKEQLHTDPEYREAIQDRHPDFITYRTNQKEKAFEKLSAAHPRLRAEMANARNEVNSIPNGATATRMMNKGEQAFLTNAFNQIQEALRKERSEFHIHGETAIIGNKKGEITHFEYTPAGESHAKIEKGSKYHLHTHPPLMEPFTSSASGMDHQIAAKLYYRHKMTTFVTNGKDVLHIQPHSTELVRLTPDPKHEAIMGKFPEAFKLPDPQRPPRPFSNHEAPAAYKGKHSVSLKALFSKPERGNIG